MKKYAKVINKETKLCEVGLGTNSAFYKSIGMVEMEVEKAYDGSYYLKGYAPTKSLSELKSDKLNELNTIASQYDSYKCNDMYITSSVGGYRFNADSRSQTNLRGLISVLDDVKSVAYKDYDNEFQSLNKEQMQIIFSECILNGQNLYKQKWDYSEKIKTCETIEELNSIEFNFTMMNFS